MLLPRCTSCGSPQTITALPPRTTKQTSPINEFKNACGLPLATPPFHPAPQDHPEFRQAAVLRGLADDAIVREGLVGVGIGAAAVGAALVVGALLGGRK